MGTCKAADVFHSPGPRLLLLKRVIRLCWWPAALDVRVAFSLRTNGDALENVLFTHP